MTIRAAIIDYGSGNLRSAGKAFEAAAREHGLDARVDVTANVATVRQATHIVLPGVGAFADCRRGLLAVPGMTDALTKAVIEDARPFLGICVGMQLMADHGLEHGRHDGLGWIAGDVVAIESGEATLKIPHMGWNALDIKIAHPLFENIPAGAHAYFVHTYHLRAKNATDVIATVDYGGPVTAAVARANMAGTQFHPEKSQKTGLQLIANFLKWMP